MDVCEYIEQAVSQIRARRARDLVAQELKAHIEDQKAYYIEQGMSEEEAGREAVRQMGDPVEVGISMDQIHRPKTDMKMVLMLVFLCGLGVCLQIVFNRDLIRARIAEENAALTLGLLSGISRSLLLVLAGGIAMGVLVCIMDYTQVLRYVLWFIGFALLFFWLESLVIWRDFYRRGSIPDNWFYLLVPLYASLLYRYRGRGWRGFAGGILAMILLEGILGTVKGFSVIIGSASMRFALVLAVMLSMAVVCGWYGDQIRSKLLCLWGGGITAVCLAFLWMMQKGGFKAERIRALLHPYEYADGPGYYVVMIRGWVGRCRLWGNPEAANQFARSYMGVEYTGSSFSAENGNILYLFLRYGIVPGVIVCLIFLSCVGYFLYKCLRQKNQLGRVTGAGCCFVFLVEFMMYLMSNFGILPSYAKLPFLSYGGIDTEVWAVLMGFVFSIIRYQNLLPAQRIDGKVKYRYRIKIEKTVV